MAHSFGGLSGWTAIAARTIGATREQGTWAGRSSPSEVLARTADADDALRLVASYRMPEERSESRGE
jgi:hypothetical protein